MSSILCSRTNGVYELQLTVHCCLPACNSSDMFRYPCTPSANRREAVHRCDGNLLTVAASYLSLLVAMLPWEWGSTSVLGGITIVASLHQRTARSRAVALSDRLSAGLARSASVDRLHRLYPHHFCSLRAGCWHLPVVFASQWCCSVATTLFNSILRQRALGAQCNPWFCVLRQMCQEICFFLCVRKRNVPFERFPARDAALHSLT